LLGQLCPRCHDFISTNDYCQLIEIVLIVNVLFVFFYHADGKPTDSGLFFLNVTSIYATTCIVFSL